MSAEPQNHEESPIRKLTPQEEKKGARTTAFIMLGFLVLVAGLVVVAAVR